MAKKQFKAESKRLLDMMIHSIYTHKEIFLRELISNASDAVDKLCYMALTDENVGMSRSDFEIKITADKENGTLTVSDNGVGMTEEELTQNLGTIAKSGSLKFKQEMEDGEKPEDIDIIGQFGVGFYSAFMVSDKVTVISRAYGSDTAWKWESDGSDGYTVAPCEKDTWGTDIIMTIKKDTEDDDYTKFLDEYTLQSLIKKYSNYIRYPIKMDIEVTAPKEGTEGETETTIEERTINSMVPIWQKNKNEVSDEDYENFYKEKFFDFEKPTAIIHMDAEGIVSYKALLFIPAKTSYDYFTKEYQKGLQLYSSGVLIMDKCADLVPEHFRFVRGVVDSPDLSLNISRELLQHDRQLSVIAKNLDRKIKNELEKLLKNEREKYEEFFAQFGLQLKYGTVSEFGENKDALKDLLLFSSSAGDKKTTLEEYAGRMREEQKYIYYATGESKLAIDALPQAKLIKDKGYEILYFTEEIDEFIAQTLRNYSEKEFKSVNSDDLDLQNEEEKERIKKKEEESKELLDFIKETLGDKVKEVRLSGYLGEYPSCIVAGSGLSFEMEKYFKTVQPDMPMKAERIMELNADNEIFERLCTLYKEDEQKAKIYTEVLYNQSLLLAGLDIEDPSQYSKLIFELM